MKKFSLIAFIPCAALFFAACQKSTHQSAPAYEANGKPDASDSVIRINATTQSWNPSQPWEKNPPSSRSALGAVVSDFCVITTAQLVADAIFIELESVDGKRRAPAKVKCVDYEVNLALLELEKDEQKQELFQGAKPMDIASSPSLNDSLDIVQVETNGQALITPAQMLSAEVATTFLPGQLFLTYRLKASMQSSASSFSLPVLHQGKLAGILSSYDGKDQISEVIATPLLSRFLSEANKKSYQGFPNIGIGYASTEDAHFRKWLKIPEEKGGIYVAKIRKGSAADAAQLRKGDVILAIDGVEIDRRGFYKDPLYGNLLWVQLVRGMKSAGDAIKLTLWREEKETEVTLTLSRQEESTRLVPHYSFGVPPNFLIKGGFIFQELTKTLLDAYDKNEQSSAPLQFLDVISNPEKYQEDHDRMICLTAVIPTQASVGYEDLRNMIIHKVNGKPVRNMREMLQAFSKPPLGARAHSIEFLDENLVVYLDEKTSDAIDQILLQRGLHSLSRAQ